MRDMIIFTHSILKIRLYSYEKSDHVLHKKRKHIHSVLFLTHDTKICNIFLLRWKEKKNQR